MKVSVIIPTHKGSNSINKALNSLVSQTYKDFEVIVVDDNGEGTDEQIKTQYAIQQYEKTLDIKYCVHKSNKNGAAARNTGINRSCGEYIAFLDDDDFYLQSRLQSAVYELENSKKIDVLFCAVLIQRNGKLIEIVKPDYSNDIQKTLILNTSMFGTGSNIFFRRSVIDDVKGFDETYSRRQDNEFLLRVLEAHSYVIINQTEIVKCNNGSANIPSYDKLKKANVKYYKDFEKCLNRLSKEELRIFYEHENERLFFCSLMKENSETKKMAKMELQKYRKLNLKELVQFVLSYIRIGNKNLLEIVQPQLSRIKYKKSHENIIELLDDEILRQLEKIM